MPPRLRQKQNLSKLYKHIPKESRNRILQRTEYFDRIGPIMLPCDVGSNVIELIMYFFICYKTNNEYFLITKNPSLEFTNPIVRISSNCFYGYIANSRRCDCKWQFNFALDLLQKQEDNDSLILFAADDHGKAIEGGLRGHALLYALGQDLKQELIYDAYTKNGFKEELRNYNDIHLILKSLRIKKIRLLTNNPDRISFFKDKKYFVEQQPIEKPYDRYLSEELGMKKEKLGHSLNLNGFQKKDISIYGLSEESFKKKV